MAASTERSRLFLILTTLAATLWSGPALGAQPRILVENLTYTSSNVSRGLAGVLAAELDASGIAHAFTAFATSADAPAPHDYILSGKVSVFTVADKDVNLDLGAQLRDLAELVHGQSDIAQVVMQLRLCSAASGELVSEFTAEGLESQAGVRLRTVTTGWAATVDFGSDEFRQTNLGYAAYKAVGNALRWLADVLPRSASVLAVTGDAVVVGFGEASGIAVGDELVIYRLESIANSLGTPVWEDAQRVAAVRVTSVKSDRCLCLVLEGLGFIVEGDTARPLATRTSYPQETDTQ